MEKELEDLLSYITDEDWLKDKVTEIEDEGYHFLDMHKEMLTSKADRDPYLLYAQPNEHAILTFENDEGQKRYAILNEAKNEVKEPLGRLKWRAEYADAEKFKMYEEALKAAENIINEYGLSGKYVPSYANEKELAHDIYAYSVFKSGAKDWTPSYIVGIEEMMYDIEHSVLNYQEIEAKTMDGITPGMDIAHAWSCCGKERQSIANQAFLEYAPDPYYSNEVKAVSRVLQTLGRAAAGKLLKEGHILDFRTAEAFGFQEDAVKLLMDKGEKLTTKDVLEFTKIKVPNLMNETDPEGREELVIKGTSDIYIHSDIAKAVKEAILSGEEIDPYKISYNLQRLANAVRYYTGELSAKESKTIVKDMVKNFMHEGNEKLSLNDVLETLYNPLSTTGELGESLCEIGIDATKENDVINEMMISALRAMSTQDTPLRETLNNLKQNKEKLAGNFITAEISKKLDELDKSTNLTPEEKEAQLGTIHKILNTMFERDSFSVLDISIFDRLKEAERLTGEQKYKEIAEGLVNGTISEEKWASFDWTERFGLQDFLKNNHEYAKDLTERYINRNLDNMAVSKNEIYDKAHVISMLYGYNPTLRISSIDSVAIEWGDRSEDINVEKLPQKLNEMYIEKAAKAQDRINAITSDKSSGIEEQALELKEQKNKEAGFRQF